jgi:putative ABC transport system ATP-binding protein
VKSLSDDAIKVEAVTFAYGGGSPILAVPEFTVSRGERVFLYGPSGSGKTTFLGLLAGILTPQSGSVAILGQAFSALRSIERDHFRGAHIGYIFQMFNLIPYLNVRENITLPCKISHARARRLGSRNSGEAADELAEHLGIASLLQKPVTELSVGQQQRVAAARALIGAPEIIIADEPTSALDTDHREAFLQLLFKEAAAVGSSILFVSHDQTLRPLFAKAVSLKDLNKAAH